MKKIFILILLLWSGAAFAACTGANPTWTSTPDAASLQTCVNNAASGSTINVLAGTVTGQGTVNIASKKLTITGAGIGVTNITASGKAFDATGLSATNFLDMSGMTVTGSNSNGVIALDGAMFSVGSRIHHMRIVASNGRGLFIERIYGLGDHITSDNSGSGCQAFTFQGSPDGNSTETDPWTQSLSLGTINAFYVEDSTVNWSCGNDTVLDSYGGARLVFRHNTVTITVNGSDIFGGGHGTDSGDRWGGPISWEIYDNTLIYSGTTTTRACTFRGGTGVVFENIYSGNWGDCTLMVYRACNTLDHGAWSQCNGTSYGVTSNPPSSFWKNTIAALSGSALYFCSNNKELRCSSNATCSPGTCTGTFDGTGSGGYPCRNQPGIAPGQFVDQVYVWSNGGVNAGSYDGGSTCGSGINNYLQSGRDFINNGTTPKPGYVAFTYPHPLQGAAPTGTFYIDNAVGHGCSDTSGQPGTLAAPWCTITYALTRIAGGNTLIVKAGTYNGDFLITGPSGTSGQHTVIQEATGESVILSGSGFSSGRVKISHGCSFIDFIGFEITNLNQGLYLDDDAGTSTACTNVTVSNLHIHDVGQEGLAVRAGTPTGPRNFLIQNSEIDHTGRLDPAQNGEGAYIGNSSGTDNTNGVTLLNNNIHDTTSECIELKGDSHDNIVDGNNLSNCITSSAGFGNGGGAIEIDEPRNSATNPNQIVRNNFIHDLPTAGGITKRGIRAGTGAKIYNNVLYNIGSTYSCILSNTANFPRVIYNNTVDCSTTNALVNSGTTVDSQNNIGPATAGNNLAINSTYFFNYAGHDYRLVSGAPIGAGANLLATVPTDILGITRTLPMDIGAYKFGSSGTPVAQLSPSSSTFAPVLVNQSSTALVIRISNIGSTSMVVSALGISGDYSIQSNTCGALPATINAGSNCTANVIFSPIQVGTRVGTFSVTDNAAGSPHTVSLSGTGIAPPGPVTALFAQAR